MTFRATAVNADGHTFTFRIDNPNWNGLRDVAVIRLAELVAADSLHTRLAPWTIERVNVSAD